MFSRSISLKQLGCAAALIIASLFTPRLANAYNPASLTVNAPFLNLDSGMPGSLAVGQEVQQIFALDIDAAGVPISSGTIFTGAITNYELHIPDAGFHVNGGSGDLFQSSEGSLVLTAYPDPGATLDSLDLLYATVTLVQATLGSDLITDPLKKLGSYAYSEFAVFFNNPSTGQTSSGAVFTTTPLNPVGGFELVVIPEPKISALLLSATGLLLALRRLCSTKSAQARTDSDGNLPKGGFPLG